MTLKQGIVRLLIAIFAVNVGGISPPEDPILRSHLKDPTSQAQLCHFWDDTALFAAFLRNFGDFDINVGAWAECTMINGDDVLCQSVASAGWSTLQEDCSSSRRRIVTLKRRPRNTPFIASVTKHQMLIDSQRGGWTLLEASVVTGVPYSDQFVVVQHFHVDVRFSTSMVEFSGGVHVAFNKKAGRLTPRGEIERRTVGAARPQDYLHKIHKKFWGCSFDPPPPPTLRLYRSH